MGPLVEMTARHIGLIGSELNFFPTDDLRTQQQKRSIDALRRPVNLARQQHVLHSIDAMKMSVIGFDIKSSVTACPSVSVKLAYPSHQLVSDHHKPFGVMREYVDGLFCR